MIHKNVAIAFAVVSAVILLGLVSTFGITASTSLPIMTQYNYGQLIALANAYIAFILIRRYI